MMWLASANALLVLACVWTLAGGNTWRGNWLSLGAGSTGVVVMASANLWPLVAMNGILFTRSAYMLWRERWGR